VLRYLPCPRCRDERAFEQPPCLDGHGVDCPEWACVDCGTALVVGMWSQPFDRDDLPVDVMLVDAPDTGAAARRQAAA
jgi:hypothetical protein